MIFTRRTFLLAASAAAARPALAESAPPALAAYERESGGRIGIYGEDLVTGARVAWRANERFVTCSTFKVSLAAFVLARVDRGDDQIDGLITYGPGDLQPYAPVARTHLAAGAASATMSVRDMCKAAVELSDNTCANMLLAHVGGPEALPRFGGVRAIPSRVSITTNRY